MILFDFKIHLNLNKMKFLKSFMKKYKLIIYWTAKYLTTNITKN